MTGAKSLWGDAFSVQNTENEVKKVVAKMNSPKKVEKTPEQILQSRKVSLQEKIATIAENVNRILGGYKSSTIVIRNVSDLASYISKAIENNVIAVDTETNNSLDPLTCKIMGLCIYTPGMPSAYVPVNHVDPDTGIKLDNQVTEEEIGKELSRLEHTCILMHNGSFDYQVIKCTCGVALHIDWDTMIGAKILDENEMAGLKWQYVNKIDPSIEKYSINHLFDKIEYAVLSPDLFALYAATDALMTYKLYLWQKERFEQPENSHLYELFCRVEMPIVTISAEMELSGVCIDTDYAQRLSNFYKEKEAAIDEKINAELLKLSSTIAEWRLSVDANKKTPKKDKPGEFNKSKSEQLETPINVASPLQLAILIYDVLKFPSVDKKSPRGTGEEILIKLTKEKDFPLGKLILERRGLEKLLNTFIDKMPASLSPRDGRLHAHFNQYGAATGRFSCISEGTEISMPGGNKKIEEVKPGDYLYCFDVDTNELKLSTVKNLWYTGERQCVRIKWVSKYNHGLNGELICTPDHFVRTTTRGWVMAKDLEPSDSILYVHRRENVNSVSLYANFGQGNEEEHAWIRDNYFGVSGREYQIHHVDSNRLNNSPSNLSIVSPKAHVNSHLASDSPENQHFCGRYNFTSDELVEMGNSVNWELTKLPYDFGSLKSWFQKYRINYIQYYTESYSKRQYQKASEGKVTRSLHLPLNKSNLIYALQLAKGNTVIASSYFAVTQEEFENACDKYELLSNHNVVSIEYLPGTRRVYDIEVNNFHNFIANELCVHNSSDPNLQNIPSGDKSIRLMFAAAPGKLLVGGDFSLLFVG